eukprot:CAMPEP_0172452548 /NCGR_PEP_ID=MMETSP1065-20121228/10172_1 /TAXON_ID=265537 /ORGANISM="Amphiprora paludosa, Strain CCMP125" /LENGTH=78 /DNA_ID=CAMNT_0013204617 /DNA_START=66 /DNA_END=298 /DNA_ORIENTATION=-
MIDDKNPKSHATCWARTASSCRAGDASTPWTCWNLRVKAMYNANRPHPDPKSSTTLGGRQYDWAASNKRSKLDKGNSP